jgi:hypothetical protein
MSRRRDLWIERIRAIEREGEVMALGLDLLRRELARDPSSLTARNLRRQDFDAGDANRPLTYLVRMFAVFENGIREAWAAAERETTHPPMRDLLDAFSARRRIPHEQREDAHRVRRLRNTVVHDESEQAEPLSLAEARRYLCRFFAYLPETW